jgi:manganese transport protein
MLPALTVLTLGLPATDSLVLSQVVLSFGIPFALVPLALLTGRRDVMGTFVNGPGTAIATWCCAAVIIMLNGYLVGAAILP